MVRRVCELLELLPDVRVHEVRLAEQCASIELHVSRDESLAAIRSECLHANVGNIDDRGRGWKFDDRQPARPRQDSTSRTTVVRIAPRFAPIGGLVALGTLQLLVGHLLWRLHLMGFIATVEADAELSRLHCASTACRSGTGLEPSRNSERTPRQTYDGDLTAFIDRHRFEASVRRVTELLQMMPGVELMESRVEVLQATFKLRILDSTTLTRMANIAEVTNMLIRDGEGDSLWTRGGALRELQPHYVITTYYEEEDERPPNGTLELFGCCLLWSLNRLDVLSDAEADFTLAHWNGVSCAMQREIRQRFEVSRRRG